MKRIIKNIISAWKHAEWKKETEAQFEAEQRELDNTMGWLYIS
jgi:hypothetical protein